LHFSILCYKAQAEQIKANNVKKAHVYNSLEQEDRVNLATLWCFQE